MARQEEEQAAEVEGSQEGQMVVSVDVHRADEPAAPVEGRLLKIIVA